LPPRRSAPPGPIGCTPRRTSTGFARPLLREELRSDRSPPRRKAAILREALANVQRQQALPERRRAQLDALGTELEERNALILARLDQLGAGAVR